MAAKLTTITKAPRLALGSIKQFRGMEGYGLNADLYLDGKKVAFILDEGCGGEMLVDWLGIRGPHFVNTNIAAEVTAYIQSLNLPAEICKLGNDSFEMAQDLEHLVNETVDQFMQDKTYRRLCKSQTLIRRSNTEQGVYYSFKVPFSADVKAKLLAKYPDIVEFINERFAA